MRTPPGAARLTTLLCLLTLLTTGCSNNSTITRSYVDPRVHKIDLQGVLIVGVAQKKASRVEFEEEFAKALKRKGVNAVPSHTLVPDMKAEGEVFIAAAGKAGLDTIMVTRFVGKSAEDVYHPGTIYYDVMPAYGGYNRRGFGGYYGHAYEVAYEQPVWSTNTTYTLISDLFTTNGTEHVWQAVSDTIKAGSENQLRDDVIKSFMDDLKDKGLLK